MHSPIIDAHIHFDLYEEGERTIILEDMKKYGVKALVSVSNHLQSAKTNLQLSRENPVIKPAFGFHPEQKLPSENEIAELQHFMELHQQEMVAVGEVGLPYYLRQEKVGVPIEPYLEILELFIRQAKALNKPIVLHAIYGDAPLACELLEKYSIEKAHFHWFKGDQRTLERLMRNGYQISITPDVLYETETRKIANEFPMSQMMAETDGPWPFAGPFKNVMTHPKMIHQTIKEIVSIKKIATAEVYELLYINTKRFYEI